MVFAAFHLTKLKRRSQTLLWLTVCVRTIWDRNEEKKRVHYKPPHDQVTDAAGIKFIAYVYVAPFVATCNLQLATLRAALAAAIFYFGHLRFALN